MIIYIFFCFLNIFNVDYYMVFFVIFLDILMVGNDGMYYVEVKWLFGGVYGRLFMMGRCFLDFGNFYFVVKRFFGRVFGRFYKLGKWDFVFLEFYIMVKCLFGRIFGNYRINVYVFM